MTLIYIFINVLIIQTILNHAFLFFFEPFYGDKALDMINIAIMPHTIMSIIVFKPTPFTFN